MNIFWIVLLVVFVVAEALTVGLTSIWFALGALVSLVASALGAPIPVQIVLFLAVSFLTMLLVRPLARKYLGGHKVATNADRAIGAEAVVTEEIDNLNGQGHVSIAGVPWSARSETGNAIPAGLTVRVMRIEGAKVFVSGAIVGAAASTRT